MQPYRRGGRTSHVVRHGDPNPLPTQPPLTFAGSCPYAS